MNNIRFLYILLLLSIFLFSTKSSESSNKIYYIIDALANGTAAFVDLENFEDKYVYFSFDFEYHNKLVPFSKDVAFFSLSSDLGTIKGSPIEITFSENNWYKLDNINDIKEWTYFYSEYDKLTVYKDTYYYKIKRTNDKMKTLLLRVFIRKKRGFLIAENIPNLERLK